MNEKSSTEQDVNLLFYQIENRIGSLDEHNKMAATSCSRTGDRGDSLCLTCVSTTRQRVHSCIIVSCLIPHAKTICVTGWPAWPTL